MIIHVLLDKTCNFENVNGKNYVTHTYLASQANLIA